MTQPEHEAVLAQVPDPRDTLAEYDDDVLAEMAEGFRNEGEHLLRLARGAHEELQQRVIARGGVVLDTEHWSGKLNPGKVFHTVDDPARLRERLAPLVSAEDLAASFVQPPAPPMREDNRGLNELAKRGGDIAAIIDEERRSVRGDPILILKRKPEQEVKT
jgi:hypothetical protein